MRHLFIHTVQVSRATRELTGGRIRDAWETVHAALRCRVEPVSTKEKETIIGRLAGARAKMTWGTEAVKEGDRVTYNGKTYIVRECLDDTGRATLRYHTCILDEADL